MIAIVSHVTTLPGLHESGTFVMLTQAGADLFA
jgi:hypothetical protein